ncbi:hypothetical protein PAXRUDRAFT_806937, partial [Paxillus rubicundulus Ve08.2h10]
GKWQQASEDTALFMMKGPWQGQNLRVWAKAYISDHTQLPTHCFRKSNISQITNESLAADIKRHLQSVGKYIWAQDIVDYLKDLDVQKQHGFKKSISLATAQQWMKELGYHWKKEPKGQYHDGHEHDNIVKYRQEVFLLAWAMSQACMHCWKKENVLVDDITTTSPISDPHVVVLFHNESTFYANDCWKLRWVHKSEGAILQPKGEGASLMVAHFVLADYGWLESPYRKESAQVLFRVGKQQDGYYTNGDIIQHAEKVMAILEKHYPNDHHILIFDNATTHVKHADDALSAQHLPKKPSEIWGIPITARDAHRNITYDADGKVVKKILMAPARFENGQPQPLYVLEGHERAGWFKGMAQILWEQGYTEEAKLNYECLNFKCLVEKNGKCYCCRFLYNQPDFANVRSLLEKTCREQGFQVLFLPKFHCELNFIEQCWGWAKRKYNIVNSHHHQKKLTLNGILLMPSTAYPWRQ